MDNPTGETMDVDGDGGSCGVGGEGGGGDSSGDAPLSQRAAALGASAHALTSSGSSALSGFGDCDVGADEQVPAGWRALSEHHLNLGQEQTLAALARGGNVLSRQPTGSGKSNMYLLPALSGWAAGARALGACADAAVRAKLPLPPICIVAVPFRELAVDASRQAQLLIDCLYEKRMLPTVEVLGQRVPARILHVRRGDGRSDNARRDGDDDDESDGGDDSGGGGGGDKGGGGGGASATERRSSAEVATTVVSFPCGRCSACLDGSPQDCWWCCRVAWPGEQLRWCNFCRSKKGTGRRAAGCSLHKTARRASMQAATPAALLLPPRRLSLPSTTAEPPPPVAEPPSAAVQSKPRRKPRRLRDLRMDTPERAIAEDASVAVVFVTPDALRSTSVRGGLLRHASTRGGRCRLFVIDEAHTCLKISQGGFREACAKLGVTHTSLALVMQALNFEPFQVLALTATMPPGKLEREAIWRLRLGVEGENLTVLRGPVDRADISMVRCFLPAGSRESSASYVLRGCKLARALASAAWAGRKLAFVTKATSAPAIAAFLTAHGMPARAFATNGMTEGERQSSLDDWRADPDVILIASSTFATGVNHQGITAVLHFGLAQDPLEHFQEDGRIRSSGLSITFLRPRFLVERATLPAPMERARAALSATTQLLKVLTHAGCLRAALVGWLGGSVEQCSGCDYCARYASLHTASLPAAHASLCGSFPYYMELRPASKAAIEILRQLSEGEELLTSVFDEPPALAPAPFTELSAHEMAVLTMVGKGDIRVRVKESSHGLAPLLLAEANLGALAEYEAGSEELFVWVWQPSSDEQPRADPRDVAEARQLIAMHQRKSEHHREIARRVLTSMLARGTSLQELGVRGEAARRLAAPPSPASCPAPERHPASASTPASASVSEASSPALRMSKTTGKRTPSHITPSPLAPALHSVGGASSCECTGCLPFPSLGSAAPTTPSGGARLVPLVKRPSLAST